jgi:hypothetical protein
MPQTVQGEGGAVGKTHPIRNRTATVNCEAGMWLRLLHGSALQIFDACGDDEERMIVRCGSLDVAKRAASVISSKASDNDLWEESDTETGFQRREILLI